MSDLELHERIEPRDKRHAEWFWVHKSVWANSLLTAADKILYGSMALFANGNSQKLFPSVLTLAKFSCLSERQVRYSIKQLKALKYIEIEKNPGKPSSYVLLDVGGAEFAPLQNQRVGGAESTAQVVQNRRTNNNKEQELITKGNDLKESPERGTGKIVETLEETRRELVKNGVLPR